MKKILFVLLIALLVIGLIACGKSMGEKAVENMIEGMMENEGVDVDVDDGGDTVTIDTGEGEMVIESDEDGMAWPGGKLPSNVPEVKGVKVVGVIDVGSGIVVTFENCSKKNADDYISQMKANGWEISFDMEADGARIVMAGNNKDEMMQFGWEEESGDGEITYGSNK